MTDVAIEAGVSQTTVSLILNEVPEARLARETRQRVLAAAERLKYRLAQRNPPNPSAIDATTIGFVVDEISTDPWMALALDGARERAWASGLTISVAVTRGDAEMERVMMEKMLAQPLLGLIYGKIHTVEIEPHKALNAKPTVLLNCYLSDRSLPSVVPAEVAGGRTATERLIRAGHRRIAFINGEPWMDASRDRLKGYRQSLAAADLPFDPDLVRAGNWEPPSGYEFTRELMALGNPPTAFFCANDLMAVGCYDALRELGLAVPGDVAVVGYDDRETARYMHPPLTTVVLPHFEMGSTAVDTLIDVAARPPKRPPQIKEEGPLIERQSV
jgi:LacI family transcriptional regulator